jgi:hypothetical protein
MCVTAIACWDRPVEEGFPGAQSWMMGDAAHVITDRRERQEFSSLIVEFLDSH